MPNSRRINGEGSKPYQRPGRTGWYTQIRVRDARTGQSRRVTVSAPTKTKLAQRVRETIAAADRGEHASGRSRGMTVAAYVDVWCSDHLPARDVTAGTRRLYRHAARNYLATGTLGGLLLSKVRTSDLERVDVELRRAGKSASTRRLAYNVARMMFDTAVRDRLIPVNPVAAMPRPADAPRPHAHYSVEQARTLLAAVEGHRVLEHLVPLMLWTGMRPGEALAVRWDDVDLDAGLLRVAATLAVDEAGRVYRQEWPKGKRARVVPLVPPAVAALRGARAAQSAERLAVGAAWSDLGLVFSDPLGRLLDDRNVRRGYARVVAAAGLTGSFHALRRSTATLLTGVGVPLGIVAQILGHSSTAVTQAHYTIVDVDMMRTALASLETSFGAGS